MGFVLANKLSSALLLNTQLLELFREARPPARPPAHGGACPLFSTFARGLPASFLSPAYVTHLSSAGARRS